MNLESLVINVTDEDINGVIERISLDDSPVTDLSARIEQKGIVLSGKARTKLVNIGFDATIKLKVDKTTVEVVLSDLKAAMGAGNMFRGKLVKQITDGLSDLPGLTVIEDGVTLQLPPILAEYGVSADIGTAVLTTEPGRLRLELSGDIFLCE